MALQSRRLEGLASSLTKWTLPAFFLLINISVSQVIYPDGGRNVIKVIKAKPTRIIPYNDGSVMTHVIGSAGMNFLYYFYILGVSCENNDPEFYKIIQTDFEFCLNKTGPLPSELRNQPLGSIRKQCYDWELHRPCYKNLAADYDECLAGRPGLVKKGTDAMRFTHAYYKFICGNVADTKAHLLDRYMKHDLIVPGVFQCFPNLQDRINNCVKRDRISKTLCSKFFIVHACFGKYFNDDNCPDVQPIYYMDDLFRNMSATLNCPRENDWTNPSSPPPNYPTPEYPDGNKGWTSREEYSGKENPWPGEMGRPWPTDKGPFVRGDGNGWNKDQRQNSGKENKWPGEMGRPWPTEKGPFVRGDGIGWNKDQRQNQNHHHYHHHQQHAQPNYNRGWDSGEKGRGRDRDRLVVDPHANRPYPDTSWNRKQPWINVMDRGRGSSIGKERNPNSIDSTRGSGRGMVTYVTRGPTRGSYSPTTQRVHGGNYQKVVLPPAGYAVTRVPQEATESDHGRFYNTRDTPSSGEVEDEGDDEKYNFYAFE